MRLLKFRQPRIAKGIFHHWHYWGYVDGNEGHFVAPLPPNTGGDSYQFTGLLDKNGKEIYEKDIVKNEDGGWTGDLYRIEWHLAGFRWFKFYDAHRKIYISDIIDQEHAPIYYGNSYEIIGNVTQHKNILSSRR